MAKRNLFDELKDGLEAIRKNPDSLTHHYFSAPDIKAIRNKLHFSQSEFAVYLGVKTKTLQNWEQGVRKPTASAQILLRVLEKEPEAVIRALSA